MTYDANGNLIKDLDRQITEIKYNLLNLPVEITFSDGNKIINKYSADGMKLETYNITSISTVNNPVINTREGGLIYQNPITKIITTGYGTQYAGNIEYLFDRATTENIGTLIGLKSETFNITGKRIHNPEGYVANNNYYYYYRKDHLGNNREVWNATTNQTVQRTQYYPSGLPWEESTGQNIQPYKAEGKEFIEVHGIDEYYSVFRNYYPAIARTTTIDPHAESYPNISPYAWLGNNFVNRIDPDGRDYTLSIQRNEDNEITGITISGQIYITGAKASADRAKELNTLAKSTFASKTINGVKVSFNINYSTFASKKSVKKPALYLLLKTKQHE